MTSIDTQLSELLEHYPAIWDRASPSFKDTIKKENAFKELASKLHVSVDVVCSRYKAIREKYRKEKIKINAAIQSGAGQLTFAPWHLMNTLRFLDAVQKPRKTITNMLAATENSYGPAFSAKTMDDEYEVVEYLEDDLNESEISENMVNAQTIEKSQGTPYSISFDRDLYDTPSTNSGPTYKRVQTSLPTMAPPLSPTPSSRSTSSSRTESFHHRMTKKQKRTPSIDGMVEKLVQAAEITAKQTLEPQTVSLNQFQHFGMYVGQSLTAMSLRKANHAMFEISQIIFKHNSSGDD